MGKGTPQISSTEDLLKRIEQQAKEKRKQDTIKFKKQHKKHNHTDEDENEDVESWFTHTLYTFLPEEIKFTLIGDDSSYLNSDIKI